MKSWIFFLAVLVWSGVVWSQPVLAAQDTGTPVRIEVLERQDCAHCLAERTYLDDLVKTRSDISVKYYDIDTPEGKDLFIAVTSKAGFPRATPVTIVGTSVFQGFDTATTTGPRIRDLIEKNRHTLDQGFASFLANKSDANSIVAGEGSSCNAEGSEVCSPVREPLLIPIPLTSKTIDISTWALPALAATMGFFDGFNPCAMWVLVTFLIILMKMGSRRRMWLVAGSFILAEGIMYYVILMVWFRVWDFIGMDRIITPIVGTVSIGGGLFFLYEWYKSLGTELACRVVDMEERSRIVQQIKRLATGKFTLITLVGIVALAFSVNVIEFACSIGYPQTFTKILQVNNLDFWHTQYLMAVYIFSYLVDDFIVFGLALWGFEKIHLTERFSRWSALLGGLLMLILGGLLILNPALLRSFS